MNTSTGCPATDELRQLLGGALSGEQQHEFTHHLGDCSHCQAKLEELATEGSDLPRVVANIPDAEPLATSAYWPALRAAGAEVQATIAQTATPKPNSTPKPANRSRGLSLDFLEPSTDSAYLGRLAHFEVMRVVGRGGMGIVLEAFDSKLRRNVALKVLDPQTAEDDTARQRFCREARAAASISHENVVTVHQVEKPSGDGLPFLVMQLVSGDSLEQRLTREGKLPLREIVRIGMQAARGLAAAHAQGLIHRDVKPGNILLEPPHDTVKLTDFGLARAVEDTKLTRTGFVTGTPLYMAPEQALGSEADPRSDLFSLGAILYEMCAGQPPFNGPSALAILKQIAETKHRPLRELNPAVPGWLAETIDRLLAKKPDDRIQTAAQVAELLEFEWALLKTTSDELPTVCEIEHQKRTRRNRLIAAGIGTTFLAVGLFVGWFFSNRNGATEPPPAPPAAAAPKSSAPPIAVLSASAGPVWPVDKNSQTVAMAVEDGAVRLWDLADSSINSTIRAHRGNVWSAKYSPNGDLLATAGDDGLLKLWKPSQGELIKTFKHTNAVRAMAFAHDGHALFTADREGGLHIWTFDADKPVIETPVVETTAPGSVYALALSPNDEILATGGSDKVVQLWNAKTLTPKISLEGHAGQVYGLTFNSDGRRLASVGWDKTVRVWDTASGQLLKSWPAHDGDVWAVAYSPDGNKLATGGGDSAVKLWNAETGDLLATFLGHKGAVHTVAFNREGTRLASGGRDGAVLVWAMAK